MTTGTASPNAAGASTSIRLPNGGYGPEHRREANRTTKEANRARIELAIKTLTSEDDARFPDISAILEYGEGFSKNRIYDNQDLMYAAQERWNDRQRDAGRPTRKLRGGDRNHQPEWVPAADLEKTRGQLARAIQIIKELRRRNHLLSRSNVELVMDVTRLELAVYEELWPVLDET